MTVCRICNRPVEIGQTIVGLPIIRIQATNHSSLAGNEVLFHLSCFLAHFKKPVVEIIKP